MRLLKFAACATLGILIISLPTSAAPKPADVNATTEKAVAFLKTKQNPDGSYVAKFGPGVTALVTAGLVRTGHGDDPAVKKAMEYLEKNIQADGGIYNKQLENYTTCVALIAFKEANTTGQYDKVIANAAKYLKSLQIKSDDDSFGGVGYGGKGRPDLSNTGFFVDALLAAGVPKDDQAIKDALIFVTRCQNLPGEVQKSAWAAKTSAEDKGGFIYDPSAAAGKGGKKSDRVTAAGGLRSEGGMTYTGLKSFLYAGVDKKDPRVEAALTWIKKHYTLAENPGMGDAGLFYYYHTFAKAMSALGEPMFEDAAGKKHDWKQELFDTLTKAQAADGSWTNKNPGFGEGSPELATAFAILALSYIGK